jgi:hypothetical protein
VKVPALPLKAADVTDAAWAATLDPAAKSVMVAAVALSRRREDMVVPPLRTSTNFAPASRRGQT